MIFNYILYLIIPWIFGIILYRKDSRTFLTIFPFGSIISLIINIWGIYMGYWSIYPYSSSYFSSILLSLGLFPILGTYLVYLAKNKRVNALLLLAAFSIISTIMKGIMVTFGRSMYSNGWNIYLTFVIFLAAYLLGYMYYILLRRKEIVV